MLKVVGGDFQDDRQPFSILAHEIRTAALALSAAQQQIDHSNLRSHEEVARAMHVATGALADVLMLLIDEISSRAPAPSQVDAD